MEEGESEERERERGGGGGGSVRESKEGSLFFFPMGRDGLHNETARETDRVWEKEEVKETEK